MESKTVIQLLYTAPFPPESRARLEYLLAAASKHFEVLEYKSIYDPAYHGLSLAELFRCRNFSFAPHPYALVADSRTLAELRSNTLTPTVDVVSVRSITPMEEWNLYNGPGDLSPLAPIVRLALLRAMAEERATLDPHTSAWFWEHVKERAYSDTQYNESLWQIKALRASPAGAHYACLVYSVKDRNAMHALVSTARHMTVYSMLIMLSSIRVKRQRLVGFFMAYGSDAANDMLPGRMTHRCFEEKQNISNEEYGYFKSCHFNLKSTSYRQIHALVSSRAQRQQPPAYVYSAREDIKRSRSAPSCT
jgi:hypothetical protein